jgi:hypothetical protein
MSVLAVVVAAVAAFVLSGAWYGALGSRLAALHPAYAEAGAMRPATVALELLRNVVLAVAVLVLGGAVDVDGVGQALLLGLGLAVFPVVILSGSVLHERVPVALAAIHAGDWVLKLLLVSLLVEVIRPG